VINSLPDHFQPGPDFFGIPWIAIIIVFLGISTLGIFLWKTSFGVSFLKTVLKLQNVHDRSTDVQRRAWRSNSRSQEGIKIGLEDLFTSWRYMEAKVRAEVHKVTTKVNSHYQIHGQRKTTEEGKLRMKECEQAEKERQLSDAEENGKLVMKKIRTYKKMFQDMQQLQWRTEDSYRCKITPYTRKALDNWVSMVAVEHHHSSGLPYSPYLMAEPLRQWMGHQPPPPSQYHLGAQPLPSAKGFLGPLTISQLECPLGPQPPSTTDDFLRRQTPPFECPLGPLPFSPADDFLRPHISLLECLLVPLPPSPAEDFLKPQPQTPPVECPLEPLPFSPADDFLRPHIPPFECLLVPLSPSPVDNFLR
uniref:Nuclear pore complex interacting protein N-terminal domain-containing protein n=1 Tax=Macaca nemestrina TaxID=9545 RepID=A0A2K6BX26_MACNE